MQELLIQSSAPALGAFIGVLIGLGMRKRSSGEAKGLLAGSVFLTASAAGGAALIVAMIFNAVMGGGA